MTGEPRVPFKRLRHDEDGRMLLDGRFFTGIAEEYWPNGALASEIPYREGVEHGLTVGWYPNGVKHEETMYEMGCARGLHREFDENGRLRLEQEIGGNGFQVRRAEWDEHGVPVVRREE